MEDQIASLKKTARLAGLLYLIIVLASVYGHMYVPAQIFVMGDVQATANNILSKEILFRSCIVAGLVEAFAFLVLGLTLYRLLHRVNSTQARLMVALIGVQIPLALLFAVFKFMALMTLESDISGTMASGELPETAMMFLNIFRYGRVVLGIFAALWLIPFGMLVFSSRFFPAILGILLMIAGTGNVIYSSITVLLPDFAQTPIPAFIFFVLGEIPIMLWLLIKGVKDHISITVISERRVGTRAFS